MHFGPCLFSDEIRSATTAIVSSLWELLYSFIPIKKRKDRLVQILGGIHTRSGRYPKWFSEKGLEFVRKGYFTGSPTHPIDCWFN